MYVLLGLVISFLLEIHLTCARFSLQNLLLGLLLNLLPVAWTGVLMWTQSNRLSPAEMGGRGADRRRELCVSLPDVQGSGVTGPGAPFSFCSRKAGSLYLSSF